MTPRPGRAHTLSDSGSKPIERIRKSRHSCVVKLALALAITFSTSDFESWMARRLSSENGRPFFSCAIAAS